MESYLAAVLRNELAWFEKPENSIGSLTSRIINDTAMVKTIIADCMCWKILLKHVLQSVHKKCKKIIYKFHAM